MWEFFSAVFQQTGILGLSCVVEAAVIAYLVRLYRQKDNQADALNKRLFEMSEKRLKDVVEEREKYEDLSQDLNKSINLLIKVFRKKNGINGD
ncbi:MAG: hypothetical protein GF334_01560 [Candidatus Altiarchaeales archaeon]|nr:hypothetical protein [Candidatus Altiarchaeales archaeon]